MEFGESWKHKAQDVIWPVNRRTFNYPFDTLNPNNKHILSVSAEYLQVKF